jgi:predicted component of type VI protein secretion system
VGGYCTPDTSVQIYVNGKRATADPTTIQLSDGKEIAIVIGTPPNKIPDKASF